MAPQTPTFHLSTLPTQINTTAEGKARKPPISDLTQCPLKELVQYKCNIEKKKKGERRPVILCEPVVRLFRQCANGVSVETTAWEGWKERQEER